MSLKKRVEECIDGLRGVVNRQTLATAARAMQPFLEAANKLVEIVDEVKRSLSENKLSHILSWDATMSAIENALMFVYTVEQFAEWGHSKDRIERVKMAVREGDFTPLKSFLDGLDTHLEQTTLNFQLFEKTCGKAREETYTGVKKCRDAVTQIRSRRTIVGTSGGITSGLLLAGGITGTIFAICFPLAGTAVGHLLTSAVAATGGVATAVGTGRMVSTLEKTAKKTTTVADMFDELARSAANLLLSVQHLNTWLQRASRLVKVANTLCEHAATGYRADVIDAIELIGEESNILYGEAQFASAALNGIKDGLRPQVPLGSALEAKAGRKD